MASASPAAASVSAAAINAPRQVIGMRIASPDCRDAAPEKHEASRRVPRAGSFF
ncbi:MAG TPA: hypothetical protein VGO40_13705 [Longimicrobium sp.]|nr:hypothetical protein [Longimicrobium sp.]